MAKPSDIDFRRIHRTYRAPLQGFFRRRGFTHEEAEDLTQDTFFRVFHNMETYEDRGTFAGWLYTIADNVCRSEWERRGTQKRSGSEIPYEEDPPPEDSESGEGGVGAAASSALRVEPTQQEEIRARELRDRLDCAIRELPLRQRQCLTLRRLGHAYKEIAVLLQIERGTVKKHLSSARGRLRQLLEDFDLTGLEPLTS